MVIILKKKLLIISILCILIDQISKLIIVNSFDVDNGFNVIKGFFSITYVKNTGAAWGMFSNGTIILSLVSIVFLFFMIKYIYELKNINYLSIFSYGMLMGGIIGNLIDRLLRNYVIDFLNFNIFGYDFPVFNIADSFIVISIILIVIESFWRDKNDSR